MEENETPHPDYLKGFNEGYMIAKYMPDLSEQLAKTADDSIRIKAFKDGRKELILEQSRERLPAWLQPEKFESPDNSPKIQRDKDKDEF